MSGIPSLDLLDRVGEEVLIKGDYVGHPFRGNQWVDASGAGRGGARHGAVPSVAQDAMREVLEIARQRSEEGIAATQAAVGARIIPWQASALPATRYARHDIEEGAETTIAQDMWGVIKQAINSEVVIAEFRRRLGDDADLHLRILRQAVDEGAASELYSLEQSAMLKAVVVTQLAADLRAQGITDDDARVLIEETHGQVGADALQITEGGTVEEAAHLIVRQWAMTSNDGAPVSLAVQARTEAVLGGIVDDDPESGGFTTISQMGLGDQDFEVRELRQGVKRLTDNPSVVRVLDAAVRAQYVRTQEYLAARGISTLEVHRGLLDQNVVRAVEQQLNAAAIRGDQTAARENATARARDTSLQEEINKTSELIQNLRGTQMRLPPPDTVGDRQAEQRWATSGTSEKVGQEARVRYLDIQTEIQDLEELRYDLQVKRDQLAPILARAEAEASRLVRQPYEIQVGLRPLSSWATVRSEAVRFARMRQYGLDRGSVISASVQARNVFALPITGIGCLHEREVVIVAPTLTVQAQVQETEQ